MAFSSWPDFFFPKKASETLHHTVEIFFVVITAVDDGHHIPSAPLVYNPAQPGPVLPFDTLRSPGIPGVRPRRQNGNGCSLIMKQIPQPRLLLRLIALIGEFFHDLLIHFPLKRWIVL